MIRIWQPRYHDRKVLVARYKCACGQGIDIEIMRGAMKGIYHATNETIIKSPIEKMRTRDGNTMSVRAISMDELIRKEAYAE